MNLFFNVKNMNLKQFIQEISPTQGEISRISISWNEIRETIQQKSEIINYSFLTGSYSRHTKIHPIDDLDIFFRIDFSNTWYQEYNRQYIIYIEEDKLYNHQLKDFIVDFDWKKCISPIKIINHIWSIVKNRYSTTNEQWRNWECYTAFFSSYNLTIDCVPYCKVNDGDFFLIPKWWNNIYWKRTNPTIDNEKINELNNFYDGKLKDIIKVLKYWNKKYNESRFKSYHLECLIYYGFQEKCNINMSYIELIQKVLEYIYDNLNKYQNIIDLPRFDYMYFDFSDNQKNMILKSIEAFYDTLKYWEENVVSYLKN